MKNHILSNKICHWSTSIIVILLLLMFRLNGFARAGCVYDTDLEGKINGICTVYFECKENVTIKAWIENSWSCIRHESYENFGYSYRSVVKYDSTYNIFITLNDANEPFHLDMTESQKANVKSLNILRGKLVSAPSMTSFTGIKEMKITENRLNEINLYYYTANRDLNSVNFSHNEITTLIEDSNEKYQLSNIKVVDISHNLIKIVPNLYFVKFSDLENLDLSYNLISNLDVLTFEGLSKLQTLYLNNNNIVNLGTSLLRFQYLKKLKLNNNELSSLSKQTFGGLKNLVFLNVSQNVIDDIDIETFSDMQQLNNLDISYNKIKHIKKGLFENNMVIESLSLAFNAIEEIEEYSFNRQNFKTFDIQGNNLKGVLKPNILQGMDNIENLELSEGLVTTILDGTFQEAKNLKYLNLSYNEISDLSLKCFLSLQLLEKLDLSYNNLTIIDLSNNNLTKLSWLSFKNNNINSMRKNSLGNLTAVKYLDLSFNKITTIEPRCFVRLTKLEYLYLDHNDHIESLVSDSMRGLENVNNLDLSGFRVSIIKNNSFSGMNSLQYLNMSKDNLEKIEYEAFAETHSIIFLDLSHNLLESFNINTTYLQKLQTLYLNDNNLVNITAFTFVNLENLLTMSISNNNLLYIDSSCLLNTKKLKHFDMSFNKKLIFDGILFKNLTFLSTLNLSNIESNFTFVHSTNTSISQLVLSSNKIQNLESLCFYNLVKLCTLNVSANQITKIGKKSFRLLSILKTLDLSKNLIYDIEPGSFEDTMMIESVNLSFNDIVELKYGVFDGLLLLSTLDLSDNKIHSINGYLFHNTPRISVVLVDNNKISDIDIKSFNMTKIKELSVGGNKISCQMLIDLFNDPQYSDFHLVTKNNDFRNENVGGISCRGSPNVNFNSLTNSSIPMGANNITMQFSVMTNALESLQDSIKNVDLKKIVDLLDERERREEAESKNLQKVINLLEIQNNISSEIAHVNGLSWIAFKNSLENITSQLKEIAIPVSRFLTVINESKTNKTERKNNAKINETLQIIRDSDIEEEKRYFIKKSQTKPSNWELESDSNISKKSFTTDGENATRSQLFYIVCGFLVFIILLMFVTIIYLIRKMKFSNSYLNNNMLRQRITDSLEMN